MKHWSKYLLAISLTALMIIPMLSSEAQARNNRRDHGCNVKQHQFYRGHNNNPGQRRRVMAHRAKRYRQAQRAAYRNRPYSWNGYSPVMYNGYNYGYGYQQPGVLGQILNQL